MQVDAGMPLFESRVDVDTTDGYISERQLQSTDVRLSELNEQTQAIRERGHLEERVLGASIEANFIVGSQVRLHRVTNACPQAYFGMILARISGGFRILNRIRLWAVVAHGKRGGGSCSLGWPW